MAVALSPDAFLNRTASTAWSTPGGIYYSYCGWRRLDADRGEFTVLIYLGHNNVGSGIQFTALPTRQLVVYNVDGFTDLLAGTGPTLAVGTWYFLGVTTIEASEPDGIEVYYAAEGDTSLTQVTATVLGAYGYNWHGVGARPGTDGQDDVFRLDGSAAYDRTWSNTTLTPTEMLAEFQSATPIKTAGLWSDWPMASAATATTDVSGNSRPLTATAGTGTITDATGPSFGTDGTASPAAIVASAALPSAGIAAGSAAAPGAIGAVATVPRAALPAAVAPPPLALAVTAPTPSTSGSGQASPVAAGATASIPEAALSAGSTVTPAALAAAATLPAPDVDAGDTVNPATIETTAALPAPAIAAGAGPSGIATAVTTLAVSVAAGAGPSAISATTALPAPVLSAGSTVTPAAIALLALLPTADTVTDIEAVAVIGTYREPATNGYREAAVRAWREP